MQILQLEASQIEGLLPQLVPLLQHVVDAGASIGFIMPLATEEAEAYWKSVISPICDNSRLLWVARLDGATVGTVQLDLCQRKNGLHRAEVMKLMVHPAQRGRGIAKALMAAMEAEAKKLGRTTLVLDTLKGDSGEHLYQALGWIKSGEIPDYVYDETGNLQATVIYYKLLHT
jgi:GNAT superfamily N-acetyltransferase